MPAGKINRINGYEIQALSSSYAVSASFVTTASYIPNAITTASVNSNTITFTKGDGSTFPITVNTGSGGGGPVNTSGFVTTSSFNAFTSSINSFTASYNTGSFSGSFTGSLFGTSSWATNALTASSVVVTLSPNTDERLPLIIAYTGSNSGTKLMYIDSGLDYNTSINTLYLPTNGALVIGNTTLQSNASTFGSSTSQNYILRITGSLNVSKSISVDGTVTAGFGANTVGFVGTASWAQSASQALTSSYAQNLIISGAINNVDYIDFNTGSAVPAWKSGRVFWDNTDGALSVYNAEQEITLQVGQENWTRVSNRTGAPILNGTAVRLKGAHGDVPEVELAQSIIVSGSVNILNQILGIATHTIENNSIGYITTQGLVRGLNTNAFAEGETLFVGTGSAGTLTNIPPRAPYEIIPIGVCVKASPGTSGIIYVAVQEPIDFSDLSSVLVSGSYHYGDIWTYVRSGSFGVWTHTNQLSGSYGLTGSLNATAITSSLFGTASWATNAQTASFLPVGTYQITSSWAQSASQAIIAQSASFLISSSFSTNIGDETNTSYTVTHNLNTRNVHITVYSASGTFETVYPDIQRPTVNTATVIFANAPTTNQYTVYISL
jgi:hypothetical protein